MAENEATQMVILPARDLAIMTDKLDRVLNRLDRLTEAEGTELLTFAEAQKMLKVGKTTLNSYITKGLLIVASGGKNCKRYIKRGDLDNFIASGQQENN